MKKLQSILEGTWVEVMPITLTQEQLELISSTAESDREAQEALQSAIQAQSEVSASSEDASFAEAVYSANKPVLEDGDTYQFISVDMTLDTGVTRGIINCRVNGEHKQIRF